MSSNEVECESCEGMVRGVVVCCMCQRRVCQACCVKNNLCFMCEQGNNFFLINKNKNWKNNFMILTNLCFQFFFSQRITNFVTR